MAFIAQLYNEALNEGGQKLPPRPVTNRQFVRLPQHGLSGDYAPDTWTSTWRPQYREARAGQAPPVVGRPPHDEPRIIHPGTPRRKKNRLAHPAPGESHPANVVLNERAGIKFHIQNPGNQTKRSGRQV